MSDSDSRSAPDGAHDPDPLETILHVEDDPTVRKLFAHGLRRAGYRVHEATNGGEAVKVFDGYGAASTCC